MTLTGKNFSGFELLASGTQTFKAINPATSAALPQIFYNATSQEVDATATKAGRAFVSYNKKSPQEKAAFLDAIAEEILTLGDDLINVAVAESGLPHARLTGERGRTTAQLKMFAQLLRNGNWVNAIIETALPDRQPLPKPDLRSMAEPLGPVVVFGASNFPFAYSAAGGDTASALAAGCPVIVKAHPSHPGTDEFMSQAILNAAKKTNMPDGVYSMLHCSNENAIQLVTNAAVKAIGFTGSRNGGMAIFNAATNRKEPIPVYAEMSAVNPVIILPGALSENTGAIANGLAASVTLGAGQFCTNPGLVFLMEGESAITFMEAFGTAIKNTVPATMLSKSIYSNYEKGLLRLKNQSGAEVIASSTGAAIIEKNEATPHAFLVSQKKFMADKTLAEEVFGPTTTVVICQGAAELKAALKILEGQLTATINANADDALIVDDIVTIMKEKAGRLVFGGFPTGVEVSDAMMHGGPFPATTDGKTTSVGTAAIQRFVRQIAYQNFPQHLLPAALQNDNPLHILRQVNGTFTKDALAQ
jgi:2,5-dioxopentanoate dehydrogenase